MRRNSGIQTCAQNCLLNKLFGTDFFYRLCIPKSVEYWPLKYHVIGCQGVQYENNENNEERFSYGRSIIDNNSNR